ncbi:MAG: ATP-binding protein [Usitatibacter sp.]
MSLDTTPMPRGPRSPDELTIGATAEESRRASEWLASTCRERGVPQAQIDGLTLCLDEALSNVIAHGGKSALSEPITLRLDVAFDQPFNSVSVTLSDAGTAFDPLAAPERVPPKTLDEALPNGMGLGMIRRICNFQHYSRANGRNHLTLGMRWDEAE